MANIADLLTAQLATPSRALYRQFVDGAWRDFGAADVAQRAARWQAAFSRDGFRPGDRVAIGLRNGVVWVALDLAALAARLVVVPLYVDDNADNQAYCVADSDARLVVVETTRMAGALARAGVDAARILCLRPDEGAEQRSVEDFLPRDAAPFAVDPAGADTLATICYTSGTAGRPKGVMLTHGNILANVAGCRATGMGRADDVFLSFLPLSHMFERTGGYYLPLALGAIVTYARGIAQLPEDFAAQRPTAIFAVPRVFEKFAERVRAAVGASGWKRALLERCAASGGRVELGGASIVDRLLSAALRPLVARPILARFGGRLRLAVVGGAPMDAAISKLFIGLGLPILQGYGMTEACPVISVNRLDDNDPETVGRPLENVALRLSEQGEIHVRGPSVMVGYWRNPEATARAIDRDGWLSTGDLGEMRGGRLAIRGRLKDVLVLSNGEKLPPQDIELAILGDGAFEQLMLVGEGRPFLTLVAVAKQADEKQLVKRANDRLKAFPRYARVRRAIVTPEPWTVENGLLTPTLKIRREKVLKRFANEIDAVYASPAPGE
ncbi:MAG TPA: AMP-binding protein [Burkholderiales bacterium]|nr:AMP-binding protein [Burkholderiales bacterium]